MTDSYYMFRVLTYRLTSRATIPQHTLPSIALLSSIILRLSNMSLTRSLLKEFRPIFRMLEEPFYNADPFAVVPRQLQTQESQGDVTGLQYIFTGGRIRAPVVRLSDETDKYVVEAEVPGIPKENLDITIEDNGRCLTIKGDSMGTSGDSAGAASTVAQDNATTDVAKAEADKIQQSTSRWSFARTLWLPRPVDSGNVKAKLDNGILQLDIPKLQAQAQRVEIA